MPTSTKVSQCAALAYAACDLDNFDLSALHWRTQHADLDECEQHDLEKSERGAAWHAPHADLDTYELERCAGAQHTDLNNWYRLHWLAQHADLDKYGQRVALTCTARRP
ncbi:hypothetical protein [Massilia sp. TSP1-1-2]|uniref:hypothetical protein n=1 Tax=Massilia sp. TSP1-1-2 TaxID=2804649 RepID=UPI003CF0ABB7